jgi:hypothetical protein
VHLASRMCRHQCAYTPVAAEMSLLGKVHGVLFILSGYTSVRRVVRGDLCTLPNACAVTSVHTPQSQLR